MKYIFWLALLPLFSLALAEALPPPVKKNVYGPKLPKKVSLPCRQEYKDIRVAQTNMDVYLQRYQNCVEEMVEPSNEFMQ